MGVGVGGGGRGMGGVGGGGLGVGLGCKIISQFDLAAYLNLSLLDLASRSLFKLDTFFFFLEQMYRTDIQGQLKQHEQKI